MMLGMLGHKAQSPKRNQLMLIILGLSGHKNAQTEPADVHDAWPVGAQKPKSEPADAHDAGPVGAQSPQCNQLMLVMLGLLPRKAQNGTS